MTRGGDEQLNSIVADIAFATVRELEALKSATHPLGCRLILADDEFAGHQNPFVDEMISKTD